MRSYTNLNKILGVLICFLVLPGICMAQLGQDKPTRTRKGDVEVLQYRNGLRILVKQEKDIPALKITSLIRAGYAYDPPEKLGLSGVLPKTFQTYVDDRSALRAMDLNYWVNADYVEVTIDTLENNKKEALHVIYDTLINPDIGRWVYKAIDELRDRLKIADENILTCLYGTFDELLFLDHPYGNDPKGTRKTLNNIILRDISTFHDNFYTPKNMVIAIVGDISAGDVAGILKERFGRWYKVSNEIATLPKLPDPPGFNLRIQHDPEQEDTFVVFGHRSPTFSDPDYPIFRLLATILDSAPGYSLKHHIREMEGYSYSVNADWENMVLSGALRFHFSCKPEVVNQVLNIALEQIEKIRTAPLPREVIGMTVSHLKNREILRAAYESNQAFELAFAELFGLDFDYRTHWNSKTETVTPEELQAAAKKYLQPQRFQVVVCGNKEKMGNLDFVELINSDVSANNPP